MTHPARQFSTDRLLFGGDYNPEQWPEEVWAEDVKLMQRARVNAATIGVFSWARLEPEEGVYDFDWMDRVIATLHEGGIGVILATPTASPPPWFTRLHPDAMPVRSDGVRLSHGSRDTYAISAPAYREASRRIATALAERYGRHPVLIAWHLHNEYGTYDWGEHAARAFRRWLKRKYGSLDELNRAWYTAFWSQHYANWDDILPPRATQYLANPTQAIDYKRFMSDEMLDAMCEQRDAIRAAGSSAPITTNFILPTWNNIEQWQWSQSLDFVSIDHYLDTLGPDGETHVAYGSDLIRSWGGGNPWLLMEQSTISSTMPGRRAFKEPERMIRNSLSYVAHGSQGALFFQWRAPAAGSEVWHGGIVPHVGADSRTFRGFEKLGRLLDAIREVAAPPAEGSVVAADVAILWHADGWWALETRQLPLDELDYATLVRGAHRALWHQGVVVDFAKPDADLSRYRLVLVPSLFAMDAKTVANLLAFVQRGGSLAVWPFTGIADEHLHVVAGGYPGQLRDLLGVRVEEFHPLAAGESVALSGGGAGELWSERMTVDDATVVVEATYEDGPLAGLPAITRHPFGAGTAYYVSTMLDPDALGNWLRAIRERAGVGPVLGVPPIDGVEIVVRRGHRADYVFVLNHDAPRVTIRGPGHDLLSSASAQNGITVARGDVAVLRTNNASANAGWVVTE